MTYTPINWQTGDTITAEKLNKMDNGWGVGKTQLFSETATTVLDNGVNSAMLAYSSVIDAETIVVTFDGVEYTCNNNSSETDGDYGAPWSGSGYDFSEFPFNLYSYEGENSLATANVGTYNISAAVRGVETSESFGEAVVLAGGFEVVSGTTTFQEACDAFKSGKYVYVLNNSSSGKTYRAPVILVNENTFEIKYITTSNSDTSLVLSGLDASSADGVLG